MNDVGINGRSLVTRMVDASDELERTIEAALEEHGTAVESPAEAATLPELLASRRAVRRALDAFDETLDEIERMVAETTP